MSELADQNIVLLNYIGQNYIVQNSSIGRALYFKSDVLDQFLKSIRLYSVRKFSIRLIFFNHEKVALQLIYTYLLSERGDALSLAKFLVTTSAVQLNPDITGRLCGIDICVGISFLPENVFRR